MLEAGEKIPESVKTGIDNGKYAIPQSVSEMLDLISYDEAVAKAEASGFEVPQSIANGIRSGSLSPAEATAEVEALISYETMITDGGFAGDSTITALTDALYAGEMRPSEVMAEANAYLASKYPEAKNAASKGGTDTGDAYNKSAEAEFTKTPGIFDRESAKATPMLNQAEKAGPMGIATVDGSAAAAEKSTSLASALKKVASSALKAVKDFLGIKSPSTVFRDQVGEMIGEGMSVGIQKSEEEVIDSLDSLVEDANKAAVSALSPLEMPKIEKDSFLSSIDALKKETLLKSIESLGSKLPKIYAEMEASAMLHFGILAGGAAANAAAWEDPYYNKQVILRADITNTLDGRLLSKASAPYMDVELRRLDSRGERSA
jgi:hypothetical protein